MVFMLVNRKNRNGKRWCMSAGDGPRRRWCHHHPDHLQPSVIPGCSRSLCWDAAIGYFCLLKEPLSFHLLDIWPCFINPAECNTLNCNLPPFVLISFVSLLQGSRSLSCCNHFTAVFAFIFPMDLEMFLKILLLRFSCVCVHTHSYSYTTWCTQRSEDSLWRLSFPSVLMPW